LPYSFIIIACLYKGIKIKDSLMKGSLLFIAAMGILMIAGCGGGDADNSSPALPRAEAPTQASPSAFPGSPNPETNQASSNVATPTIDPPSPPIAMSAGVTETIDAPLPASPLAQIPTEPGDQLSTVAAQQVSPAVHFPADPSTGSDD
jgi:hypothetical protein